MTWHAAILPACRATTVIRARRCPTDRAASASSRSSYVTNRFCSSAGPTSEPGEYPAARWTNSRPSSRASRVRSARRRASRSFRGSYSGSSRIRLASSSTPTATSIGSSGSRSSSAWRQATAHQPGVPGASLRPVRPDTRARDRRGARAARRCVSRRARSTGGRLSEIRGTTTLVGLLHRTGTARPPRPRTRRPARLRLRRRPGAFRPPFDCRDDSGPVEARTTADPLDGSR